MISFHVDIQTARLISKVAARTTAHAEQIGFEYDKETAEMDLTAAHANGCPIDFVALLDSDASNFGHDVFGIRSNLDRTTGELRNCFVPRSALRE